jgi:hypothetical protein
MAESSENKSPKRREPLTEKRIDSLKCPAELEQVFLRDTTVPGLAVRCTAAGTKSFVFESKLNRRSMRVTLGLCDHWGIDDVRKAARALAVQIDKGIDPRQAKRELLLVEQQKEQAANELQGRQALENITVAEAWEKYLAQHQSTWSQRHYQDHLTLSQAPGVLKKKQPKNPKSETDRFLREGPLYSLIVRKLVEIDTSVLDATALANISTRKAQTKLAFRLFKTFLKWCVEHKEYKLLIGIIQPKLSSLVEKKFGKNNAKRDALRRVQLESWFCSVRNILNPIISAALQVMLLIGARENEVLSLRWQNIDFELKEILIKDKVEGDRLIPLTPPLGNFTCQTDGQTDAVLLFVHAVILTCMKFIRSMEERKLGVMG